MKVSIITVTWNCVDTIKTCLESLVKQAYSNIEHIVIDGASTDGTLEVLDRQLKRESILISESDAGVYDALNKGIALANGEIIGILHSDDVFSDSFVIEEVVSIFQENTEVDMVFGNVEFFVSLSSKTSVREYSSAGFSPWKLRFGFMPAHTATFIRKSVFERLGLYRKDYKSGGDFEFFVRALWRSEISYIILDRTLVKMRVGGISTSGLKSYWQTSEDILRALRENGIYSNWFFVLTRLPIKKVQQLLGRL